MISWTTDPAVAANFAGEGGIVIQAVVPRSAVLPQTLAGAAESEVLIPHMLMVGGL